MTRHLLVCWTLAAAGCASLGESVDHDLRLEIPEGLRPALAAQVSRQPRPSVPISMTKRAEIDHKGNFGRPMFSTVEESTTVRPDGLYESTAVEATEAPTGASRGLAKAATLCGLVPVLSESGGTSTSRATTAVPAGNVFVPFGFTQSSEGGMRVRLTRLDAGTTSVCDPKPGDSFVLSTQSERQWTYRSGVFGSNRLATVHDRISCSVGAGGPAATLNPALSGDYLPVSCRHTGTQKGEREATYAFVRALGLYIMLREVAEWQTTTVKLTGVR